MFGAILQKKFNPKLVLLAGAIVGIGGIFISSFSMNLAFFLIFYSCFYGIGMGIAYFTPLMTGWEWFPEKKGTISGIVLGVLGTSAFFFGFICLAIVNPDNDEQLK